MTWDTRNDAGRRVAAGFYSVVARIGREKLVRPVLVVH
jgi:hypothetical protein